METLDDFIGFETVKTSKMITRMVTYGLKPYKITAEQWSVLKCLYELDGVTQKDLSERVKKDQATLTKILDILSERKFIERRRNPDDRRSFLIFITHEGRKSMEKLSPIVEELFNKIAFNISEESLSIFYEVLNQIQINVDQSLSNGKERRHTFEKLT